RLRQTGGFTNGARQLEIGRQAIAEPAPDLVRRVEPDGADVEGADVRVVQIAAVLIAIIATDSQSAEHGRVLQARVHLKLDAVVGLPEIRNGRQHVAHRTARRGILVVDGQGRVRQRIRDGHRYVGRRRYSGIDGRVQ